MPSPDVQVDVGAEVRRLESELEQMTAELIGVQDQLLAVFDLTRVTRRPVEPRRGAGGHGW